MRYARVLAIAAGALVTSSCSLQRYPVAIHAVQYNKAAADAQDQMLLLNVLRARDRKPMHFTTLTSVSGNTKVEGRLNFSIPYTGGALISRSVNPGVTVSTGPSYEVSVENKKKFVEGILSALSVRHMNHYISQGWSKNLIYHMFISDIVISFDSDKKIDGKLFNNKGTNRLAKNQFENAINITKILFNEMIKKLKNNNNKKDLEEIRDKCILDNLANFSKDKLFFINNPDSKGATAKTSFDCFQRVVRFAARNNIISISPVKKVSRIGPPLSPAQASDPRIIKSLISNKGSLSCFILPRLRHRDHKKYKSVGRNYEACSGSDEINNYRKYFITKMSSSLDVKIDGVLKDACGEPLKNSGDKDGTDSDVDCGALTVSLTLRSVQGMLYYLGEALRGQTVMLDNHQALIRLSRGIGNFGAGGIKASYGGQVYAVRKSPSSRGLQALALVNQLLGLQRDASELTSPSRIELVR